MAIYLPDHNGLFVHCPKTGGTFVTDTLEKTLGLTVEHIGLKHGHKDMVGPLRHLRSPVTFTVVRHPVSWYASYWQMKMRDLVNGSAWYYWQAGSAWHPNWPIDPSCGDDDFAQFIKKVTAAKPHQLHATYRWYTGLGTRDPADIIGKQETLTDDLIRFLDAIGADYDKAALVAAKPKNVAKDSGPMATWTPELKELVLAAESRLLIDYGYDEDGPLPGILGRPAPRSQRSQSRQG